MSVCYFHMLIYKNPINRLTTIICVKIKISKFEVLRLRMIQMESMDQIYNRTTSAWLVIEFNQMDLIVIVRVRTKIFKIKKI